MYFYSNKQKIPKEPLPLCFIKNNKLNFTQKKLSFKNDPGTIAGSN